jgi:Rieske 2Fe-2S family protein
MTTATDDPAFWRAARSSPSGRTARVDLSATLRPFAEARTLPAECYVSEDVFRVEQAELFSKMWLCVGRTADIPEPGDWFAHEIVGDSVIVMRGADGDVRALYNVCRHRGARLLDEPSGRGLSRITCPYHAWSYRLDGTLNVVPKMAEGFRREDFGLVPVRVGIYEGFIFLNLDPQAEPLEQYLRELPDWTRFRMADLRCGRRATYDIAANWKLIAENYSECYHCPGVHPQLFRISDYIARSHRGQETGNCFNGGPMVLRDGCETMSMSGKRTVPVIPGLPPDDHKLVYYYVIYPNMLLSPHPDYVLTHTAWPIAPNRTRVICEWLFTQEAISQPGFDPGDMVDFWDVTNRQDWGLCERAQLGAQSQGYRPGPYQPAEDCVHTFDRWYAERIGHAL